MTKRERCFSGLVITVFIILFSCQKENTPPVATYNVFPPSGDTTTVFLFDASESNDAENPYYSLYVRWDWDNDGIWDTPYSSEKKDVQSFPDPGTHIIRLQVKDIYEASSVFQSEIVTWGKNPVDSMTDSRDQQVYKIVKVGSKWWMAENLNIGKLIPDSVRLANNGLIEKYAYNNVENKNNTGGSLTYYLWQEAMGYNYTGQSEMDICPPGWHIPGIIEWEELFSAYLKTFTLIFTKAQYGINGLSSMNLTRSEYLRIQEKDFPELDGLSRGLFWTSDSEQINSSYLKYNPYVISFTEWEYSPELNDGKVRGLYYTEQYGSLPGLYTFYTAFFNNVACPVRCIKD